MPNRRIAQLILKEIDNSLTGDEKEELETWINKSEENRNRYHAIKEGGWISSYREGLRRSTELKERARIELHDKLFDHSEVAPRLARVIKLWLFRAAIAAMVIIAAGTFWMYMYHFGTDKTQTVAKLDLQPGRDRAVLILEDGQRVELDTARNGVIRIQAGTKIKKDSNAVIISHVEDSYGKRGETHYNTIVTPKGGQYKVVFPDGSDVYLNAASSIRFPTSFANNSRKVELTGEGFFEITDDPNRPFQVVANGTTVNVLGTRFDLMAYDDEEFVKTTLVNGAVMVNVGNHNKRLRPGEQGTFAANGDLTIRVDTTINDDIAWVGGMFQFHRKDIHYVMRQLARWYDVEVEFSGDPAKGKTFTAAISRSNDASQIFKMLELSGGAHFKITESNGKKKIVVQP